MQVFVAGATGETGRRIVQILHDRQIPVRALVRDRVLAQSLLPAEVEGVVGDVLDPAGLRSAMAGCTALIIATGARPSFDMMGPYKVDYAGTKNLVQAAQATQIEHIVLVSSLCVSQFFHLLNLFWLVLFWKQQAEMVVKRSGIPYTIVRPGGLKNDPPSLPLVMAPADTLFEGSIARQQVVEVCVEALLHPQARHKVVEIVARAAAPVQAIADSFALIPSS
ncbi:NAD(P)H-binding protein [Trichothermofontia sichuanensis B231]|uniref:NAD(P)H-binding protein n=1 Tax=Trichothermofontia sichuanensis TaxID=3045816 RepID=UPI0022477F74|nr:NAD(P)H-binding protein [Trichothermofontia sichuanensis]UZQ53910.1 NAD(P)H-binding protein [Trichothermofontia sichuanensis B231]